MRGDLSETSAADVCRELAASGADGVLDIEGPDGRGALVWRDGAVIAATSPTPRARLGDRLVGAGLLSEEALTAVLHAQARDQDRRRLGAILVDEGLVSRDAVRLVAQEQVLDAVFDVLRWRYGAYRLDPLDADSTPEIPLRLPVPHLLAEIGRRQQEWAELERVIPDLASVPTFREQVSADAALEPDEFAVLASIDGARSVRELAADLGYGEFEAARIVFGLWLLGIVDVTPPEDEVGRALDEALAGFGDEPDDEPERLDPAVSDEVAATTGAVTVSDPDDEDELDLDALLERLDAERPVAYDAPSGGWVDPPPTDVPTAPPEAPTAPPGDQDADPPDAGGPAEDPGEPTGGPGEPAEEPGDYAADQRAAARDSDDVAELLRELSRLALDDDADPPSSAPPPAPSAAPPVRPTAPPPTRPGDRDDGKRKRRGLFGRG